MSNDLVQFLNKQAEPFEQKNEYGLVFAKECEFAKQQITRSDGILNTASNNQMSLVNAIQNVASIGISLNPALSHAYLVPREGSIVLDISYKGLIKLATDSGAIKHAVAETVYEGDRFIWKGAKEEPIFEADVFNPERMNIKDPFQGLKGAFCITTLPDDSVLCDFMTAAELIKIRDTSKAKNGPWKTWPEQMMIKSMLKRASNTWPQGNDRGRVDSAVAVLNEHEGIDLPKRSFDDYAQLNPEQMKTLDELLMEQDAGKFHAWYNSLDDALKIAAVNVDRPRGEKGKFRKLIADLDESGRELLAASIKSLEESVDSRDLDGAIEILGELSDIENDYVYERIAPECHQFLKTIDSLS